MDQGPNPVNLKVSLYFKGTMKPTSKKAHEETHYMAVYRSSPAHSLKALCSPHYMIIISTLEEKAAHIGQIL